MTENTRASINADPNTHLCLVAAGTALACIYPAFGDNGPVAVHAPRSFLLSAVLRSLSGLLMNAVLLATLLSATPALHQLLHADALAPSHDCVVQSFQAGQVDGADPQPSLPVVAPGLSTKIMTVVPSFCLAEDRQIGLERAPPRVFASFLCS